MMEKQKRILDIIPVEMSVWACHYLGLESNGVEGGGGGVEVEFWRSGLSSKSRDGNSSSRNGIALLYITRRCPITINTLLTLLLLARKAEANKGIQSKRIKTAGPYRSKTLCF